MKVLRLSPPVLFLKPLINSLKIAHGEYCSRREAERGGKWERSISRVPGDHKAFNINSILDTQSMKDGEEREIEQFLCQASQYLHIQDRSIWFWWWALFFLNTYNQYPSPISFHHRLQLHVYILSAAFHKGHLELIHLKSVEPKNKLQAGSWGHGFQKRKISVRLDKDLFIAVTNNNYIS